MASTLKKLFSLKKAAFKEQFAYGQLEILLDYLGLDYSYSLAGRLQHGSWYPNSRESFLTPISRLRFQPFWVYSKRLEEIANQANLKHVRAIGAPWYYMKHNINEKKLSDSSYESILIMPQHSTVNYINKSSVTLKNIRAKEFRSLVGNKNATVCLYYMDYLDLITRESFLNQGFEVTCLGMGNNEVPWSPQGSRREFLYNLYNLMIRHTHFAGEAFSTSLFYAMDLNLKIGIFPELRRFVEFGSNGYSQSKDSLIEKDENSINYFKKGVLNSSIGNFNYSEEYETEIENFLGKSAVMKPDQLIKILKFNKINAKKYAKV
jgi:hypothetical protein